MGLKFLPDNRKLFDYWAITQIWVSWISEQ